MATLPPPRKPAAAFRSVNTTAQWRTSPRNSPSCARPKRAHSPTYSARMSNDWPPSPTATVSAPRTSPSHPLLPGGTDHMTTTPERILTQDEQIASLGRYGYGWADSDSAGASAQRGLSEAVVR